MKIALQGEAGSFHHQAANHFFNDSSIEPLPCTSFSEVFRQMEHDAVDYGIVAVENSLYGSIHETYDQLVRYSFSIIGEVELRVQQQLIAVPGATLTDITEVLSHPAALDQCRGFLESRLPKATVIEHSDTAGAVMTIARKKMKHQAAIASTFAAALYGMEVLEPNIEDEPDNITRFIILSKNPSTQTTANKASLLLVTDHQPGALYRALGIFNDNSANLTKLESRQVRGEPYRYQFIVDCMATQEQLISIIHQLEQQQCEVKLLGHFTADKS